MDDDLAMPIAVLEEVRPHAQVVIRWRGPEGVSARVHIKAQPPERDRTHAWRVEAGEVSAVWRVLRRMGASGEVSLRWREEAPAPESPEQRELRELLHRAGHVEASVALTALHAGQALAALGRPADAMAMLRFGLAELGALHAGPELVDDSGTRLVLAEHALNAGQADEALALMERALESRTAVYVQRFGAS